MTDDLVKRWDDYVESMGCAMGTVEHMAQKMRDRIEALTAANARLREALRFYADASWSSLDDDLGNNGRPGVKARAALTGKDET